jgi:hypothetical protein
MTTWQDIGTADRSGPILGYQATPGDHENRMAVCWPCRTPSGGVFWIGDFGLMPTHWMPLPEPPSSPSPPSKERE